MYEYLEGATPLDPDEAEGLIPVHIKIQKELNDGGFIIKVPGSA